VIDSNREYARLTGHESPEQVKGRHVLEWTLEQDKAENAKAIAQCLRDGFIHHYVVRYSLSSGRVTPVEINATVIGEAGSRRILTLCRDISDRLAAERIMQNSQKLESLGVLAGGIAHDFNNLLTGIFGYIELIRMSLPQESKNQHTIDSMTTVFNRARALTQQLLTFSKGGTPAMAPVSLGRILTETAGFALSGSNVKAVFRVPDTLWPCKADEHQISQVIDNVVINARQAMPLGGTVTVTAENIGREDAVPPPLARGNYVRISISDTGIGIAPDILPRIFDPFFTTKQMGSGLGLATAYSIIKKHGGHIYADSETGRGTTFVLYLPAAPSESPAHAARSGFACDTRGKGFRILLMDDETFIHDIGRKFSEQMGIDIRCASDGKEAVSLYKKAYEVNQPFSVVILDLTVPGGMGGEQSILELKAIDPAVKAIASSGHSNDPILSDPAKFGFRARLNKPYLFNEFVQTVTGLLFGRRG
jgi:PAS domain S-box-containing protein